MHGLALVGSPYVIVAICLFDSLRTHSVDSGEQGIAVLAGELRRAQWALTEPES